MSPIYSYFCKACNKSFEEIFTIKNRPDYISCRDCKKRAKYELSPTQFEVKGANAANRYAGESNYQWFGVPGSEKK